MEILKKMITDYHKMCDEFEKASQLQKIELDDLIDSLNRGIEWRHFEKTCDGDMTEEVDALWSD